MPHVGGESQYPPQFWLAGASFLPTGVKAAVPKAGTDRSMLQLVVPVPLIVGSKTRVPGFVVVNPVGNVAPNI